MNQEELSHIVRLMPEYAARSDLVCIIVAILSVYRLPVEHAHEVLQLVMSVMYDVEVNPENHEYFKLPRAN